MIGRAELSFFAIAGCLFLGATQIDAYNTELSEVGEDDPAVVRQHFSLEQRLGYAVLVGSGYVELHADTVDLDPTRPPFPFDVRKSHPDLRCVNGEWPAAGNVDSFDLFLAILATEKYNRASVTRRAEVLWAKSMYWLTGHVADISIGPAQIRPSTIRADFQKQGLAPLSDAEILQFALTDCSNILAASKHVAILISEASPNAVPLDRVAEVARAYNGSAGGVEENAYVAAVVGAYKLLNRSWSQVQEPAVAPADAEICFEFPVGAIAGSWPKSEQEENPDAPQDPQPRQSPDDMKKVLAKGKRLEIGLLANDPVPASYLAYIMEHRRTWIVATLDDLGLSANAQVIDIAKPRDSAGCWPNKARLPGSRATARIFK